MGWTLTTSGAAISKAGANANSTVIASGALLLKWSDQAEGKIVAETRRNWVTKHSDLATDVKSALDNIASSEIAKQIINYDMSGYTSSSEALTMMNIQDDVVAKGMRELKDFKSNEIKDP